MATMPKPLMLIILDGWGHREAPEHNAIAAAKTPCWDKLWKTYPHSLICASGNAVGLPEGQMGNSEVGHLHIGAGRLMLQDLTRIDESIMSGELAKNKALLDAIDAGNRVHIIGLLSPGGVHSHENHIATVKQLVTSHNKECFVHAILDGRDTPPKSAAASLKKISNIATVIGRYYAMDRDHRTERTQQAFDLLIHGSAKHTESSAIEALDAAYNRGETDEFVKATLINRNGTIKDGDSVIFMNFRADRARQLVHMLIDNGPKLKDFVTLTEYAKDIQSHIAFPPIQLKNILAEQLSKHNLKQLRVAETEKYAHVTFFMNGGIEEPFPGEERILVPSPKVATYDLQPEMSAVAVTDVLVEAIGAQKYDLIICNYANPDMVGHTGDFDATVKAIETIDMCLARIIAALEKTDGEALVTADHGNAENMFNPSTGQAHTAHTSELVPLIYTGKRAHFNTEIGRLADIAPSLLFLLGLKQPSEMTGHNLLK